MAAVWLLNSSDNVNCFSKVGECAKMLTMLYCAIAGFFLSHSYSIELFQ